MKFEVTCECEYAYMFICLLTQVYMIIYAVHESYVYLCICFKSNHFDILYMLHILICTVHLKLIITVSFLAYFFDADND